MTDDTNHQKKKPGAAYVALAAFVALLICLVLQFSAAGKLLGPNLRLMIIEKGAEGWADGLPRDHVIAGVEMLIVVLLAFFYKRRFVWPFVALFFSALLGYSGYALITGQECGCFGELWAPPKGVTVGLNGAFILGAFILMFMGRVKPLIIGLTLALCVGAGGYAYYQAGIDHPSSDSVRDKDLGGKAPIDILTDPGNDESTPSPANNDEAATPIDESGQSNQSGGLSSIPELAEAMRDAPGEMMTYVFFHEEGCNVCESLKPIVEQERDDFEATEQPVRVLMYEINELQKSNGISVYAWEKTPTVYVFDGGQPIYYEIDLDVKTPGELYEKWLIGEDLGGRDLDEAGAGD